MESTLAGYLWHVVTSEVAVELLATSAVISRLDWGWRSTSKLTHVAVGSLRSQLAVGQGPPFLPHASLCRLPEWPHNTAAGFAHSESAERQKAKTEAVRFYSSFREMTGAHRCFVF